MFDSCDISTQDTLQNVSHDLECIFKTGRYHFVLPTSDGINSIQLHLEYQAASAIKRQPQAQQESTTPAPMLNDVKLETKDSSQLQKTEAPQTVLEKWGSEQIADFVRRLGFVESKEDEKRIHDFLLLNEVLIISFSCLI